MIVHHELTDHDLTALEDARLFFSYNGERRVTAGTTLIYDDATVVEPYSAIFAGVVVPSMGSYTYCWSPLTGGDTDLRIGRYCSIAGGIWVLPGNHAMDFVSTSSFTGDDQLAIFRSALADAGTTAFARYAPRNVRPGRDRTPVIGNDVWVGQGAVLGRGITLGDGCIVGASANVTRSVPPYAIVGGNPARTIRMRFEDKIVERLMASAWWRYRFTDFGDMRYDDPLRFVGELEEKLAAGALTLIPEGRRLADILGQT